MPVAPASFSVWQLVQPAVSKTCLPWATRSEPPPPVVVVAVAVVVPSVVVGGGGAVVVVAPVVAPIGGSPATDGDVGGDVVRVVAGDELRPACPVTAASRPRSTPTSTPDGFETGKRIWSWTTLRMVDSVEALRARPGEGVVEVRADLPLRSRVGERVAGAALLLEQLFPCALSALPAEMPPVPQPAVSERHAGERRRRGEAAARAS